MRNIGKHPDDELFVRPFEYLVQISESKIRNHEFQIFDLRFCWFRFNFKRSSWISSWHCQFLSAIYQNTVSKTLEKILANAKLSKPSDWIGIILNGSQNPAGLFSQHINRFGLIII